MNAASVSRNVGCHLGVARQSERATAARLPTEFTGCGLVSTSTFRGSAPPSGAASDSVRLIRCGKAGQGFCAREISRERVRHEGRGVVERGTIGLRHDVVPHKRHLRKTVRKEFRKIRLGIRV